MTESSNTPYTAKTAPPGNGVSTSITEPATGQGRAVDSRRVVASKRGVALIAAVVLSLVGWSMVAEIDETVAGEGAVIPAGRVQPIQHLEGGVVRAVPAKEGQLVAAGDVLLQLDPAQVLIALDQAKAEEASLRLKAERLRAIGAEREPDFSFLAEDFKELVQDQWAVYNGFLRVQENQRLILESRIEQHQSDLRQIDAEDATLARKAQILAEELTMRETLFRKGLTPKVMLLNVKRQISDARGAIAELITRREKVNGEIEEARTELSALDSTARRDALDRLDDTVVELARATERRRAVEARAGSFDLRAPVRGFVKGIGRYATGQVVAAGSTLMEIVPIDDELVAEIRIQPRDVRRVSAGQAVTLRVRGAGSAGQIDGELRDVSATTFSDADGGSFFRATVALDQAYLGDDPAANRILPGMEISARVRTGRQRVLDYLLHPLGPPRLSF